MPNKNQMISDYIVQLASQIDKQYKGLMTEEKVKQAINMFKDSSEEYDIVVQKINALAKQMIQNYLEE